MRKDYTLRAEVEFTYDPEKVDPFYWINPDTGKRQWRMEGIYSGIQFEDEVWEHLAYNAIINSVYDVSKLDGWADLKEETFTMYVVHAYMEEGQ